MEGNVYKSRMPDVVRSHQDLGEKPGTVSRSESREGPTLPTPAHQTPAVDSAPLVHRFGC